MFIFFALFLVFILVINTLSFFITEVQTVIIIVVVTVFILLGLG